jgi:hypothetical protein
MANGDERLDRYTLMIKDLYKKAHAQALEARSVEYLLKTRAFEDVWRSATEVEKKLLLNIKYLTIQEIGEWADNIRKKNVDFLTSRELRAIARGMCIKDYSRKSVIELKIIILKIWESNEN